MGRPQAAAKHIHAATCEAPARHNVALQPARVHNMRAVSNCGKLTRARNLATAPLGSGCHVGRISAGSLSLQYHAQLQHCNIKA